MPVVILECLQELTEKVTNDIYKFIPEFEFKIGREKKKSSDAYIRKDKTLLAIEAKGFSVLIDCMIKNEKVEDNNKKLFVKPILPLLPYLLAKFTPSFTAADFGILSKNTI